MATNISKDKTITGDETKVIKRPQRGGNRRKYSDPKILKAKVDEYFVDCKDKGLVPTLTGLGVFLDFVSRQSLYDYMQTPAFGDIVKKAKFRIEAGYEQRLASGKPPIGLIFALKNGFGWSDKQEMDITSNGQTLGVIALPTRIPHK
jgi:hypothetical protein